MSGNNMLRKSLTVGYLFREAEADGGVVQEPWADKQQEHHPAGQQCTERAGY